MQISEIPLQNHSSGNNYHVFLFRIIRAIKLDNSLYEGVKNDNTTTGQSITVIILSAISGALGAMEAADIPLLLLNIFAAVIGWLLWAYITLIIGTKILPEPQTVATYGEMIRVVGFASSPGLFRIFGFIPFLGPVLFIAAGMWMIVAMVVAIKQVLGYESWFRPVIVSLLGWVVQILILLLLSLFVVR